MHRRGTDRDRPAIRVLLGAMMLILACAVTPTVVVGPADAAPVSPMSGAVHYVALGDSRAAGPSRAAQYHADGCSRTGDGYPNLIAAALSPTTFVNVTCGGATTADVVDRDQITNPPVRRRVAVQASALTTDTTLVTLSIGGNDLRWRGLLTPCFATSPNDDRMCRADPALAATIAARFAALARSMDHVLTVIRERSPMARIVVVGHGGYFGAHGCHPDADLNDGDAAFVQSFFTRFDNVLAGATARNNSTYVDLASAAVGHDACAPVTERWFTGSVADTTTPANHPTPAGNAAMARLVLTSLGAQTRSFTTEPG